jgi:hypothetical protein
MARPSRRTTWSFRTATRNGLGSASPGTARQEATRPVACAAGICGTPFLDDFLKLSGYHGTGDAVADTIKAATALQSTGRTAIAKPRARASSRAERGET